MYHRLFVNSGYEFEMLVNFIIQAEWEEHVRFIYDCGTTKSVNKDNITELPYDTHFKAASSRSKVIFVDMPQDVTVPPVIGIPKTSVTVTSELDVPTEIFDMKLRRTVLEKLAHQNMVRMEIITNVGVGTSTVIIEADNKFRADNFIKEVTKYLVMCCSDMMVEHNENIFTS